MTKYSTKNLCFTLLLAVAGSWQSAFLNAQDVATFEEFALPADTFLNGSDGGGGYSSGPIFLPNSYNPTYESWAGWSISSMRDTVTPGFMNQYSSASGDGANNSPTYAVSSAFFPTVLQLRDSVRGRTVAGLYINNSTYVRLSVTNGDSFAKKFGGETGDDPDFFLLTIKGFYQGMVTPDSVDFFLADFRFEDNREDYVVSDWQWVELSGLGPVDSLSFSLSSSDESAFGINTPAYFCVDDLELMPLEATSTDDFSGFKPLHVFPNPAGNHINLNWQRQEKAQVALHDFSGRVLRIIQLDAGTNQLDLSGFPPGMYTISSRHQSQVRTVKFMKH